MMDLQSLHIKQIQKRELNDMKVRTVRLQSQINRDTKILSSRCDLCNDEITDAPQDFEYQIDVLTEIDDIFESDYDKEYLSLWP